MLMLLVPDLLLGAVFDLALVIGLGWLEARSLVPLSRPPEPWLSVSPPPFAAEFGVDLSLRVGPLLRQ